ncbi:MAG TPA: Smr/MutS family protein [Terriglobales bacterium]|nr:Smr/MutS family protein [Terriglobales bacterium]
MPAGRQGSRVLKTVNLKFDLPPVSEALQRLQRELETARREGGAPVKIVHGYGSSGVGGDIRIAVQKRLREMVEAGELHACIFGEDWSASDEDTWRLLERHPELKKDAHLGRGNRGISIVVLKD